MKKLLIIAGLMLFATSTPSEAYHRCNPVYTWVWTPYGYQYQYMGCGYYNSEHYRPYRNDYRYPRKYKSYNDYNPYEFRFDIRIK